MGGNDGEAVDIEQLALEFLQGTVPDDKIEEIVEEAEASNASGNPAWQSILDAVPAEYHEALKPQLQEWDTGVSRKFQQIHDKYEPLKAFEGMDPSTVQEATEIYQQLISDPAATWESIGKVFGLSPQETAQSVSSMADDEDFDDDDLPASLKERLAKYDDQGRILDLIAQEIVERKEQERVAEEDLALETYLDELEEQYGEFDNDYVVSLLAVGIDGEEAVERYMKLTGKAEVKVAGSASEGSKLPKVMSGSGGVPSAAGNSSLTKLSNQDTKSVVEEILRLAAKE